MDFEPFVTKLFDNFLKIFSLLSVIAIILIWFIKCPPLIKLIIFFFEFQGTILLASAFSASISELSANCNEKLLWDNLKKFYSNCKGSKGFIGFNPLLFFSGIIFLLLATILSAIS